MGYTKGPKAAVYVQPDLTDGDWSVDQLQKRLAAQQEAANKANMATWPKSNTLTASEIKTLDGTYAVGKGADYNDILAPVSLVTKQPRGYTSGVSKLESDDASKPVKG